MHGINTILLLACLTARYVTHVT